MGEGVARSPKQLRLKVTIVLSPIIEEEPVNDGVRESAIILVVMDQTPSAKKLKSSLPCVRAQRQTESRQQLHRPFSITKSGRYIRRRTSSA